MSGGKKTDIKVILLDDTVQNFKVPIKAIGHTLFEDVVTALNLTESNYFDMEYTDINGVQCWLDPEKAIMKQVNTSNDLTFRFSVKFYTPDPGVLEEEYTRYLFALQIKRDLATGILPVTDNTAALLAAYIAQSEFGDFNEEDCQDHTYLQSFNFVPNQTDELEQKIMEYHKTMIGQSPAEADFNLLDTARKVELYGHRMHHAKHHEGGAVSLTVASTGIFVYQNATKINTFSWAKIRKLSFKRRLFLVKLHPEGYGYYKDLVEFYFDSRNECKNFWKKCIEHHAFFRCLAPKTVPRNKTRVLSRGSSFRYSGRTQKQLVDYVREHGTKMRPFERSQSMRSSRSASNNKSSTLNSREAQLSMLSASAGYSSPLTSTHLERADVHDETTNGGTYMVNDTMFPAPQPIPVAIPVIQPHGLAAQGRMYSAPVFSQVTPSEDVTQSHLTRSHEVENIPERVSNRRDHLQRQPSIENIPEEIAEETEVLQMHQNHEQQYTSNQTEDTAVERDQIEMGPTPTKVYNEGEPMITNTLDTEIQEPVIKNQSYAIDQNLQGVIISSLSEEPASSINLSNVNNESQCESQSQPPSININTNISGMSNRRDHERDRDHYRANNNMVTSITSSSEEEVRRKRYPADKAYFVAKELLMTERTYKKDMEVLTVWFRNAVNKEDTIPDSLSQLMFSHIDPIYEFHCNFLREIESRLSMWEGKSNAHLNGDYQRIGDIMLNNMKVLKLYQNYIEHHEEILTELELATRRNKRFEQAYKDFESQKACYLPLNTFLLKPAQRLLHYQLILKRLLRHYNEDHIDYADCESSLQQVMELTSNFKDVMLQLENLQKLIELQRDLVGVDNLVQPGRQFIREGCLQKLSRKGYQQRMFFLLSDMFVYTSRSATQSLQFKVHGQIPLRGMIVEETDPKMAVANSFTIYGGNRCLLVAASSPEEKDKWIEDLNDAISVARERGENKLQQLQSLKSSQSSEDGNDSHDSEMPMSTSTERQVQHRANTTMHVCWHRNTSVSMKDHSMAVKNQLSGYLLRKFKNSNGWQKLWVVFTNFCLFFYKTFQDDFPLASLPLLGYSVSTPADEDEIRKDYVFKLQFKNHVYFFRAESEYTFERWIEVINSATTSARRLRTFSRMESQMDPPES